MPPSTNSSGSSLSVFEYRLLETLVLSRGHIITRFTLEARLYEGDHEVASNSLEVLVSRLRRKLGKDLIQTRRGIGYCID